MKFTDLFIRRPVLALVVNLVILIAGVQAIRSLNVRQYPRSDNAAVTVTTVYVGASADLVRGFITTPLERAIAAADGIDYIESQSALGLSTITVRLKLNYDPTRRSREISSKVDQVRNDLPPEAEVPIINVESADSPVRLGLPELHLGHPAAEPDHRLPGARRAAAAVRARGACSGPTSWGAHLRHAHLAQARPHGGAEHQPGPGAPGAGGQQLPLRRRPDQGLARPGRTSPPTPTCARSPSSATRRAPAGRRGRAAGRHRRRGAGRGGLRHRGAVFGPKAVFMGDLAAAQRQLAGRHQAGPRRDGRDPEGAAHRAAGASPTTPPNTSRTPSTRSSRP